MSSVGKLFAIMPGIGAVFGQSAKLVETSDPVFRRVQATGDEVPVPMATRFATLTPPAEIPPSPDRPLDRLLPKDKAARLTC